MNFRYKKIKNFFFQMIMYIFFIFMLVFPAGFSQIKIISLFGLFILSLDIVKRINRTKFYGLIFWEICCLIFLIIGIKNGYELNNNDIVLIFNFFLMPILAIFISEKIRQEMLLEVLDKILIRSLFILIIVDIVYLLTVFKFLPFDFMFSNTQIFGSRKYSSSILEFRITNQTSLMFLGPYLYSTMHINKKRNILLMFVFLITFLSGRRTLQIVILAIFIIHNIFIMIIKRNKSLKIKKIAKIILFLTIIFALGYFVLNYLGKILKIDNILGSFFKTFIRAFDFKNTSSGKIRADQTVDLLVSWSKNIVLGRGLNSYSDNIIRSVKTKWSYEFVYLAYLMQTGIVGLSIFFGMVSCNFYKLKNRSKNFLKNKISQINYGILLGSLSFIIAGSSNPMVYLSWFWIVFLI